MSSENVSSRNLGTSSGLPKACWIARNVIKNCMRGMFDTKISGGCISVGSGQYGGLLYNAVLLMLLHNSDDLKRNLQLDVPPTQQASGNTLIVEDIR